MQELNLPDFCKTAKELKDAGISYDEPVLDDVAKRGPGKSFYTYLFVFFSLVAVLYTNAAFLHFFGIRVVCILALGSIFCSVNALYRLGRYFYYVNIRKNLRNNRQPIMLQPVGVVVEYNHKGWIDLNSRDFFKYAVVYKEAGVGTPQYYITAYSTDIPESMPAENALLYRHIDNSRYYSIESSYNLNVIKMKDIAYKNAGLPA